LLIADHPILKYLIVMFATESKMLIKIIDSVAIRLGEAELSLFCWKTVTNQSCSPSNLHTLPCSYRVITCPTQNRVILTCTRLGHSNTQAIKISRLLCVTKTFFFMINKYESINSHHFILFSQKKIFFYALKYTLFMYKNDNIFLSFLIR
jgi:hypothetical protein